MPIVDELLQEELTKAGVPDERQVPILTLARTGLLVGEKPQLDRLVSKQEMEQAWDYTLLPLPKRLEILNTVSRKAIGFLEKIREKQPWRN